MIDRIKDTDTFQGLRAIPDPVLRTYLVSNEELWARAYAQYIACKRGNRTMKDQVDATLQPEKPGDKL